MLSTAIIRVGIIEDLPLLRTGLEYDFAFHADQFNVVGSADGVQAAVPQLAKWQPHVLLLDVHPSDMDTLQAIALLRAQLLPAPKILGYSVNGDAGLIRKVLNAGASGYLLKTETAEMLREGVRAVALGMTWLSPGARQAQELLTNTPPGFTLTEREQQILQYFVRGASIETTARAINLSTQTLSNQLRRLYNKLGVANKSQAVAWATKRGYGE
jgi:DNA-binding NarL/FixJ family response regulator